MRLGAVVLSHQPGDTIVATVTALKVSELSPAEILVVDNGSSDESMTSLTASHPSIEVMRLATNDGYGVAMNAAAAKLTGRGVEALLFLTQETIVEPDAIGHLIDCVADRHTGVAGPILCRRSDRGRVWSAGGTISGVRQVARHLESGRQLSDVDRTSRVVDWLDGACLLMPATAFQAVGGFRADLFLYWEDIDLCRRLRDLGWRITCVGSAVAYQEPAMTPPYLGARNRALVLGRSGAAGARLDVLRYAVADLGRGRGLRRARLAWRGVGDASRHQLDRSIALERPS